MPSISIINIRYLLRVLLELLRVNNCINVVKSKQQGTVLYYNYFIYFTVLDREYIGCKYIQNISNLEYEYN